MESESGGTISRQMRRLGNSRRLDPRALHDGPRPVGGGARVFVRLHEEGLIYRGKRLVNWDPVLHTALSDLEVLAEEEAGFLWHLRYPVVGDGRAPRRRHDPSRDDAGRHGGRSAPRRRALPAPVGQHPRLPLTDRTIPIIADAYVDPAFGSGCVKITPAHDFNDYEIGKRHGLADDQRLTRMRRSTTTSPPRTAGSIASKHASGSSLTSMRPGCSKSRSRTRSWCRAATAAACPRTLAHRPVVRAHRAAGRARDRGSRDRRDPLRAGQLGEDVLPVDAQHPGLVHQPPALVGPPHPGLVRRRR
jgi:hypothetical protein